MRPTLIWTRVGWQDVVQWLRDHNAMDFKPSYGFEMMSNAQGHSGVQVSVMNFKQWACKSLKYDCNRYKYQL